MSKKVKWLSQEEAKRLGFKPKEDAKNRRQNRYYLDKQQVKELSKLRNSKKEKLAITGKSTLRDGKGNLVLEWVKTSKTEDDRAANLRTAIEELKKSIKPEKPTKKIKVFNNENLCNQYTLTDYHLGMMAWSEEAGSDWDLKIAEDTLVKFFEKGIASSPNAKECIFAQIGDFLHWDGLDAVTPASKHVLDADSRFTKLVRVAIRVIRRVINLLLQKYEKVTLLMAEGNHDPASSVWLRELFKVLYENETRVIVNTSAKPYYCIVFGKVCLFYHHGHKRNFKALDNVFVGMFKKEYGESEFVYGHTGHLHHDKIESNLMILEQHRTLASKDAYAARGGYLSGRDSKVITYHKEYGEVGRIIININMLK